MRKLSNGYAMLLDGVYDEDDVIRVIKEYILKGKHNKFELVEGTWYIYHSKLERNDWYDRINDLLNILFFNARMKGIIASGKYVGPNIINSVYDRRYKAWRMDGSVLLDIQFGR